nr:WAS/WASL-interacting protein family member 3-like [Aegilops tauschii subsp. strangulata]
MATSPSPPTPALAPDPQTPATSPSPPTSQPQSSSGLPPRPCTLCLQVGLNDGTDADIDNDGAGTNGGTETGGEVTGGEGEGTPACSRKPYFTDEAQIEEVSQICVADPYYMHESLSLGDFERKTIREYLENFMVWNMDQEIVLLPYHPKSGSGPSPLPRLLARPFPGSGVVAVCRRLLDLLHAVVAPSSSTLSLLRVTSPAPPNSLADPLNSNGGYLWPCPGRAPCTPLRVPVCPAARCSPCGPRLPAPVAPRLIPGRSCLSSRPLPWLPLPRAHTPARVAAVARATYSALARLRQLQLLSTAAASPVPPRSRRYPRLLRRPARPTARWPALGHRPRAHLPPKRPTAPPPAGARARPGLLFGLAPAPNSQRPFGPMGP